LILLFFLGPCVT